VTATIANANNSITRDWWHWWRRRSVRRIILGRNDRLHSGNFFLSYQLKEASIYRQGIGLALSYRKNHW